MKKLLILVTLLFLAAPLYAGCITNASVVMYLDPYRAAAWFRASAMSLSEGYELLVRDTEEGTAKVIPKGTRIDWYENFPKGVTIAVIDDEKYITATKIINAICR